MTSSGEQPDPPSPNEKVGYRHPPESTRFKKGQSGNSAGRPRGSLNLATVLRKTLRERVIVNENGKRKVVTKFEAAIMQLVNKAAGGELRALRQLVELAREVEAKEDVAGTQEPELGELDKDVIELILKRFQAEAEGK